MKRSNSLAALLDKVVNISVLQIIILIIVFTLISMFSLSAQTPRKDSGADGPTPLQIGDKVPDAFWKKEHLFYINGDTIRKTLIEYKGKPLIIDFWATFCQACIEGFPKLNQLQEKFDDRINILLINSIITKDDFKRIHQIKDATLRKGNLKTIFKDQYFAQLFPFKAIPQYLWINHKGMIEAVTTGKYLNNNQIEIIATYQVKQ